MQRASAAMPSIWKPDLRSLKMGGYFDPLLRKPNSPLRVVASWETTSPEADWSMLRANWSIDLVSFALGACINNGTPLFRDSTMVAYSFGKQTQAENTLV